MRAANGSLAVPGSVTASGLVCSDGARDLCHAADGGEAEQRAVRAEAEVESLRAELAALARRMRSAEERLRKAGL